MIKNLMRVELVANDQPVYINPEYIVAVEGIGGGTTRCRIKTVTGDYQAAFTADDFVAALRREIELEKKHG